MSASPEALDMLEHDADLTEAFLSFHEAIRKSNEETLGKLKKLLGIDKLNRTQTIMEITAQVNHLTGAVATLQEKLRATEQSLQTAMTNGQKTRGVLEQRIARLEAKLAQAQPAAAAPAPVKTNLPTQAVTKSVNQPTVDAAKQQWNQQYDVISRLQRTWKNRTGYEPQYRTIEYWLSQHSLTEVNDVMNKMFAKYTREKLTPQHQENYVNVLLRDSSK